MPMTLRDLATLEPPTAIERIGRGMTDLYEPVVSLYYQLADPARQTAYDLQRAEDEARYLRGLLGDAIPQELRGAVPDLWRALGQSAPFFPLGPLGGLSGLTPRALTKAAANTVAWAGIGQPLMSAGSILDFLARR